MLPSRGLNFWAAVAMNNAEVVAMNLAPVPFVSALAFCDRVSTLCWSLTADEKNIALPETALLATAALLALLSRPSGVLSHPLFEGDDRLSAFAYRLNQGLPYDMAASQRRLYDKEFKPSAGLSEEYQASQYFRLLAAQMIDGLRHCSQEGWEPVVDDLPFKDQMHLANALEMFGDEKLGGQVRERCQRRAGELFWRILL